VGLRTPKQETMQRMRETLEATGAVRLSDTGSMALVDVERMRRSAITRR